MATAIRIKLVDLLKIFSESSPVIAAHARTRAGIDPQRAHRGTRTVEKSRIDDSELEAIRNYILAHGPTRRRDLEFEYGLSNGAVLRRLGMLMERGVIERLPGNYYSPSPTGR